MSGECCFIWWQNICEWRCPETKASGFMEQTDVRFIRIGQLSEVDLVDIYSLPATVRNASPRRCMYFSTQCIFQCTFITLHTYEAQTAGRLGLCLTERPKTKYALCKSFELKLCVWTVYFWLDSAHLLNIKTPPAYDLSNHSVSSTSVQGCARYHGNSLFSNCMQMQCSDMPTNQHGKHLWFEKFSAFKFHILIKTCQCWN